MALVRWQSDCKDDCISRTDIFGLVANTRRIFNEKHASRRKFPCFTTRRRYLIFALYCNESHTSRRWVRDISLPCWHGAHPEALYRGREFCRVQRLGRGRSKANL